MKGYISIDIPTKPYIKAYIINLLGSEPIMNNDNIFGNKLNDLLLNNRNEFKDQYYPSTYSTTIRVFITNHIFQHRGCNLNETNITNFNNFCQTIIKDRFHQQMDYMISILPSIEANISEIRAILGIDIESWSDDSMKKDYYRYRKKFGKKLLYNK